MAGPGEVVVVGGVVAVWDFVVVDFDPAPPHPATASVRTIAFSSTPQRFSTGEVREGLWASALDIAATDRSRNAGPRASAQFPQFGCEELPTARLQQPAWPEAHVAEANRVGATFEVAVRRLQMTERELKPLVSTKLAPIKVPAASRASCPPAAA